jgi:hypothetical protein
MKSWPICHVVCRHARALIAAVCRGKTAHTFLNEQSLNAYGVFLILLCSRNFWCSEQMRCKFHTIRYSTKYIGVNTATNGTLETQWSRMYVCFVFIVLCNSSYLDWPVCTRQGGAVCWYVACDFIYWYRVHLLENYMRWWMCVINWRAPWDEQSLSRHRHRYSYWGLIRN